MRSGLGYQLVFRDWDGTPVPGGSLCSLVAAMATAELKLGLSCLGSRATQLGPEPKGLSTTATRYNLSRDLSQKHIFCVLGETSRSLAIGRQVWVKLKEAVLSVG